MGLFSKPNGESVFKNFEGLSPEEKDVFVEKFNALVQEQTKGVEENAQAQEEGANNEGGEVVKDAIANGEVAGEVASEPKAENTDKKEDFMSLFKQFAEEQKGVIDDLKAELTALKEEKKAEESVKSEKKPFGLAESSKEYGATQEKKMTSQDLLKKLFS